MVEWTQEQKDKIWHLYTIEQRSIAQIAQQMAGEGATRANIARLIGQINMSREAEVDAELERAKKGEKYKMRRWTRGGYLKEKRSDNKLTQ